MARRVSACPDFGTVPSFCPLAGLITSMVAPESAPTHSPPIRLNSRRNWLDFFSMGSPSRGGHEFSQGFRYEPKRFCGQADANGAFPRGQNRLDTTTP